MEETPIMESSCGWVDWHDPRDTLYPRKVWIQGLRLGNVDIYVIDGQMCAGPAGKVIDSMNFGWYIGDLLNQQWPATKALKPRLTEFDAATGCFKALDLGDRQPNLKNHGLRR